MTSSYLFISWPTLWQKFVVKLNGPSEESKGREAPKQSVAAYLYIYAFVKQEKLW